MLRLVPEPPALLALVIRTPEPAYTAAARDERLRRLHAAREFWAKFSSSTDDEQ